MKKMVFMLLVIGLMLTSVSSLALSPQTPEIVRRAVSGQSFNARCTGYESVGGNFAIYLKLYERARYSEADILAIGETDYIDADIGSEMVYSVTPSEDGYILNESDPNAEPVYMIPDGSGCFFAQDANGQFYMKEALEISCPIAADAQFIDASDPDGESGIHTAEELIAAVQGDRSQFGNVDVTFNEDGKIAMLQKNPSTEDDFGWM